MERRNQQPAKGAAFALSDKDRHGAAEATEEESGPDKYAGRRSIQASRHSRVVAINPSEQEQHQSRENRPENQCAPLAHIFSQDAACDAERLHCKKQAMARHGMSSNGIFSL